MHDHERLLKACEIIHSDLSPACLQDNIFYIFEQLYHFPRINLILFRTNFPPVFLAFKNMDPHYISLYADVFYQKDVFIPSKVRGLLKDRFILTYADVTSLGDFKRKEFYNDFIRPQGIEEMLMICFPIEADLWFVIGLACSSEETSDLHLLQELNALARHIRIAIRNTKCIEILRKSRELVDSLARCASMGIFLIRDGFKPICLTPHYFDTCASLEEGFRFRDLFSLEPSSVEVLIDHLKAKVEKNRKKSATHKTVQTLHVKDQSFELEMVPFHSLFLSPGMSHLLLIRSEIHTNEVCKRILKDDYKISDRENEVISLIFLGYSNDGIADRLCVSLPTVKGHIGNIFEKMDVINRTQLCYKVNRILFQTLEI